MSFSDSDPFNHLELRYDQLAQRVQWECESCGGTSHESWHKGESVLIALQSWRRHLTDSHKLSPRCAYKIAATSQKGVEFYMQCDKEDGHGGPHHIEAFTIQ